LFEKQKMEGASEWGGGNLASGGLVGVLLGWLL